MRNTRVAVVTGGTRGIGLGIASSLARDGYNLVLGYNSNHSAAQAAQTSLSEKYGVQVEVVAGDVAKAATVEAMFAKNKDVFGSCTAFVHNAGLIVGVTTAQSDAMPKVAGNEPLEFDEEYEYYQKVYPRCFKRGVELALGVGGLKHIIAISALGANFLYSPQVGHEARVHAKASMECLARSYAKKLAPELITCNIVIPGPILTGAWEGVFTSLGQKVIKDADAKGEIPPSSEEATAASKAKICASVANRNPMGIWGEASHIGDAVAFLCSPQACYITGITLPVDGGQHLA